MSIELCIKAGPRNPAVLYIVNRECGRFGSVLSWRDPSTLALRKDNRVMLLQPKQFTYGPYIAENFDTFFAPLTPVAEDGLETLDFSKPGNIQTYRRSGLQFEMASFTEDDGIIEDYFRYYTPQAGDTVFDIGAHCGVSTYRFSQLVGDTGRVISFEPDPINFPLLLRNIERHNLKNVTCLQIAIAASRGRAEFHSEGTIGSMLKSLSTRSSIGGVAIVETLSLTDAFQEWGVPSLCKIDIEGAEIEVISSSADLLRKNRVHFVLDTCHIVNGVMTYLPIETLFRQCNYEATSAEVGGMTTWARPALL